MTRMKDRRRIDAITVASSPDPRKRPQGKRLAQLRLAVYRRDDYRCTICGRPFPRPGRDYTGRTAIRDGARLLSLDHLIPVGAGGTYEVDNLRAACDKPCNNQRGMGSWSTQEG